MSGLLQFQAIAWHAEDVEDDSYAIKCFGRTADDRSVALTVTGFCPYFFVKVPPAMTATKLHNYFTEAFPEAKRLQHVKRKDFWGFTNDAVFDFIRIEFDTHKAMKAATYKLARPQRVPGTGASVRLSLYESNFEPYLRFIHERELQPTGWLRLERYGQCDGGALAAHKSTALDLECDWRDVSPAEDGASAMAPFLVASFDIECTSSGGEFPVPRKSYKRLATQLVEVVEKYKCDASDYEKKETFVEAVLYALGLQGTCRGMERNVGRVEPKARVDAAEVREHLQGCVDDVFHVIGARGAAGLGTFMTKAKWLPALSGDAVIQIGTTFHRYGSKQCHMRRVMTLGTCDPIEGAVVETFESEAEMLLAWQRMILETDPDIVTGYNISGFDFDYMKNRAEELGVAKRFLRLSRLASRTCAFKEQKLSSSALGDNILKYVVMEGRVIIDLMKVVQRDHKLDSYKLDHVAQHFTGHAKNDVTPNEIFALQRGSSADRKRVAEYCIQDCELCNHLMIKLEIVANNVGMSNVCIVPLEFIFLRGQGIKIFSLVLHECRREGYLIPVLKKDVSVGADNLTTVCGAYEAELHKVARSKIDAAIKAAEKALGNGELDGIGGSLTFSSIATAILREVLEGQFGVPDASVGASKVFPYAKPRDVNAVRDRLRAALAAPVEDDAAASSDSYEGAIVLDPVEDIYLDAPVSVMDYASLYPSSMISENLSHDRIVLDETYDNLPGVEYLDVRYDVYKPGTKQVIGERVCRFAQGAPGIVPRILQKLLSARKATRKKMSGAADEFRTAVLDGLQNAYKVTANSIYGQIGARTSQIYLRDIAACTTATGRKMILMAKDYVEREHGARVVYGDTDSIFMTFPGVAAKGRDAIVPSIRLAQAASAGIKDLLKKPHDLEYEKTFWPFILLSKKRYAGNVYVDDDASFKQKSMGIVLKRRDNANIVKVVYGGVLERILDAQDLPGSLEFLRQQLDALVRGCADLRDLVVSKSLRAEYKDPSRIAHKVLADRIAARDPGNAPQINDRVPYVYVCGGGGGSSGSGGKVLQGERIESPEYVRSEGLTPDYGFYITNQIMKPVLQVYSLVVEKLPGFESKYALGYFDTVRRNLEAEFPDDADRVTDKLTTIREVVTKDLLFDPVLRLLEGVKIPRSMLARKYGGVGEGATAGTASTAVKKPRASRAKIGDGEPATKKPRASRAKKTDEIGDGEPATKKPRASRAKKPVVADMGGADIGGADMECEPLPKPRASRAKKTVDVC